MHQKSAPFLCWQNVPSESLKQRMKLHCLSLEGLLQKKRGKWEFLHLLSEKSKA